MASELMILQDKQILEFVERNTTDKKSPYDEDILLVDVLVDELEQTTEMALVITSLSIDEVLTLKCSNDAMHPHVVNVLHGKKKLGVVPQVYSIIISRLMKAGKKLCCKVSHVDSFEALIDKYLCNRLICKIYLQD